MNLSEFKGLSIKEVNTWGVPVSKFNQFPSYYQEYVESRDYCLYYTQYSEFLWAIGDGRFKFLEIELDDDVVCIFFKCILYISKPTMKLYDFPLSMRGNQENEKYVMKIILDSDYNTAFVLDENQVKERISWFNVGIEELTRDWISDNFYSSLDFVESKILNKKFRSKYGINRLETHYSEKVLDSLSQEDIEVAENIYKSWSLTNAEPGEWKAYKGMLRYRSDNVKYFFFYYDGEPIGISILLDCGKYFIEEFCYTEAKTKFDNNPEKHALLNKIVFYIKYRELKYMCELKGDRGILSYCLSSGPSKNLYKNKLVNNEGTINYYIVREGSLIC